MTIYSEELFANLMSVLEGVTELTERETMSRTIDVLILLKNYQHLARRLEILRIQSQAIPTSLLAETELLIEGLLEDSEVFTNLVTSGMYGQGIIDLALWNLWQHDEFDIALETLDLAVSDIDEQIENDTDAENERRSEDIHDMRLLEMYLLAEKHAATTTLRYSSTWKYERFLLMAQLYQLSQNQPRPTPLASYFECWKCLMCRCLKFQCRCKGNNEPVSSAEEDHKLASDSLRLNFATQHASMLRMAKKSSTKFRTLSCYFEGHRVAWKAGIKAMKGLSHGKRPAFADTIALLCLVKAMSETLRLAKGFEYDAHFVEDLPRWQLLFDREEDQIAYWDAVRSIWFMELDLTAPYTINNDLNSEDILQALADLASILVRQVNEYHHKYRAEGNGFLENQDSWRQRNNHSWPHPNIDRAQRQGPESNPPPNEAAPPKPPDPHIPDTYRPDPHPPDPHTVSLPLAFATKLGVHRAEIDPVVILLLCGAIFAILLVFLQCKHPSPFL